MIEPQFLPIWLTGILMLALAGWLAFIDFSSRVHRAFALVLFVRGSTFIMGGSARIAMVEGRMDIAAYISTLAPYFHIALVMVIGYFLTLYPRPRTVIATSRVGPWLWTIATLALMGWYMTDHNAYRAFAMEGDALVLRNGPLGVLAASRLVIFGIAAWLIAREYERSPRRSAGYSKFLILAGFLLAALQDGATAIEAIASPPSFYEIADTPLNTLAVWLPLLTIPFVLGALVSVARVARKYWRHDTMQEPRWFLLFIAPLPILTTLLSVLVEGSSTDGAMGTFFLAIWRLAFPFLVTYALLRHQLFEVDARVKANVARAIMLGSFTVAFFLVMEGAEAIFAGNATFAIGIIVAGLLAPIGQPLRVLASKAASRIMPDTKPIVELGERDRQQFYLEQFQLVADDGVVTTKERHMLEELAFSLKLAPAAAAKIEAKGEPVAKDNQSQDTDVAQKTSAIARVAGALGAAASFAAISQIIETIVAVDDVTGGIMASAFVALVIGPVEGWVDHMRKPREERQRIRRRLGTFRHAVYAAWEDGRISQKELNYLDRLQKQLGLSWADRKKAEGRFALRSRARRMRSRAAA